SRFAGTQIHLDATTKVAEVEGVIARTRCNRDDGIVIVVKDERVIAVSGGNLVEVTERDGVEVIRNGTVIDAIEGHGEVVAGDIAEVQSILITGGCVNGLSAEAIVKDEGVIAGAGS